MHFAMIK